MKKFKTKKNLNIRMMFFLVIFLLTLILYLDISSNFSLGLISLIEPVVKQNLTKSLSDNFKLSILKNYDIDNLVTIKYNDNNELADVNFRINDAYSLASEICNELKLFEFSYTGDLVNIIEKDEQNIVMEVPVKQFVKLNYIRDFLYEIKVVVKNYGINSLHIELYLNLKINSQVFFIKNESFFTEYTILLSSKIINGKIPSIYGTTFEKNTGFLNI